MSAQQQLKKLLYAHITSKRTFKRHSIYVEIIDGITKQALKGDTNAANWLFQHAGCYEKEVWHGLDINKLTKAEIETVKNCVNYINLLKYKEKSAPDDLIIDLGYLTGDERKDVSRFKNAVDRRKKADGGKRK